ncbi:hypothetical protein HDU76_007382 [Blyttiomyces sp. JEL0837]|nr:hypothetical protein HDU76_007382 [Blyttiomyces sp. JEL0837]
MAWFKETFKFFENIENFLFGLSDNTVGNPDLEEGEVDRKFFLQLGINKDHLSSDFQGTPYLYYAATRGVLHKDTLFVWDVTGRFALHRDKQQTYFLQFATGIVDLLGMEGSVSLKLQIRDSQHLVEQVKKNWDVMFDIYNNTADIKSENLDLREEDEMDLEENPDKDFTGFYEEMEPLSNLVSILTAVIPQLLSRLELYTTTVILDFTAVI